MLLLSFVILLAQFIIETIGMLLGDLTIAEIAFAIIIRYDWLVIVPNA